MEGFESLFLPFVQVDRHRVGVRHQYKGNIFFAVIHLVEFLQFGPARSHDINHDIAFQRIILFETVGQLDEPGDGDDLLFQEFGQLYAFSLDGIDNKNGFVIHESSWLAIINQSSLSPITLGMNQNKKWLGFATMDQRIRLTLQVGSEKMKVFQY